ncbi:MAG: VWA domain-containing protein [Candidatus Aminicenantales bacterium]
MRTSAKKHSLYCEPLSESSGIRRKTGKFLVGMLLAAAAATGLAYAAARQDSASQESHAVMVRLVLVDVIPTRKDEFVGDLKLEDFEVFEDGKPVPLLSCVLIGGQKVVRTVVEDKIEEAPPTLPEKRLAVIFDAVNSWGRHPIKSIEKISEELISLVRTGDKIMVWRLDEGSGLQLVQPFTTDETLIRKAVTEAAREVWDPLEDSFYEFPRDFPRLEEMPTNVGEASTPPPASMDYLTRAKYRIQITLGGILAGLNSLNNILGRKSLLFVSPGIPDLESLSSGVLHNSIPVKLSDPYGVLPSRAFDNSDLAIRAITNFANTHNISIYSLDPDTFVKEIYGGDERNFFTGWEGGRLKSREKLLGLQVIRQISEDTGAVSLKGAKKYSVFRKTISRDLGGHYELSFTPSRKTPDGLFHKVTVRVKRKGVDIRFREGYTDYTDDVQRNIKLAGAVASPSLSKELPFAAEWIPFINGARKCIPWIALAIPLRKIFGDSLREGEDRTLNVQVMGRLDGDKDYLARIPITYVINAACLDHVRRTDYQYSFFTGPEIDFDRQPAKLVFFLSDPATEKVGTVETALDLSAFDKGKKPALVNCVAGIVRNDAGRTEPGFVIDPVDGQLACPGLKFQPKIAGDFASGERFAVFLQIHLPGGAAGFRPLVEAAGEDGIARPVEHEVLADTWDDLNKVWSGLLSLNPWTISSSARSLIMRIPSAESEQSLIRTLRLRDQE